SLGRGVERFPQPHGSGSQPARHAWYSHHEDLYQRTRKAWLRVPLCLSDRLMRDSDRASGSVSPLQNFILKAAYHNRGRFMLVREKSGWVEILDSILQTISKLLMIIAAVLLVLVALLIATDVFGRGIFNNPIIGVSEVV